MMIRFWQAVLVRDRVLTETLWKSQPFLPGAVGGDPMRLALICGCVAERAASQDPINATEYLEHANIYRTWACMIFDHCKDREDANYVLRRPSQHGWPNTILHVAVKTDAKVFVGHQHVQTFVDDSYSGKAFGSVWGLPEHTSAFSILLHVLWPTIELIERPVDGNWCNEPLPLPGWKGLCCTNFFGTLWCHWRHQAFFCFLSIPQVKFVLKFVSWLGLCAPSDRMQRRPPVSHRCS